MGFVTPAEIVAKAGNAYPRFLKEWIRGAEVDFFPHRIRARFTVDAKDPKGTIRASEVLLAQSKVERGWGYTVHREQVRTRDFGSNPVPTAITIDTLNDLLRLTKKSAEFQATCRVVDRVRSELPQLEDWLRANVRSLHRIEEPIDGLTCVARFFMDHPWPDCYSRQIPVPVDTKFIQRHGPTLRQWLDLLLPSSAMDVNETIFARRFGLRDGQPHRAVRLLDSQLQLELGFAYEELSLPLRSIAQLPVKDATVVIVENDLNLLTLPSIKRGIGIRGEGSSVNRLECLKWLTANRVLYWGDIDVDGFLILARLRNLFPHVESVMMNRGTMLQHETFIVDGNGTTPAAPTNLTAAELDAFEYCLQNNRRLEQEKILQRIVDDAFANLQRLTS